nr:MAG TPA: hypothetical protein [Caudoviricetes sp.]
MHSNDRTDPKNNHLKTIISGLVAVCRPAGCSAAPREPQGQVELWPVGCEPQERLDEPQVEHLLAHIWNIPVKTSLYATITLHTVRGHATAMRRKCEPSTRLVDDPRQHHRTPP